jgi:hypothetical protein
VGWVVSIKKTKPRDNFEDEREAYKEAALDFFELDKLKFINKEYLENYTLYYGGDPEKPFAKGHQKRDFIGKLCQISLTIDSLRNCPNQ